jgi:putative tricarboxylic transport membrane protein
VRTADRITAVLLLAFSAAFSAGALKYYTWWGDSGPGSAFLPFWLGLVMAALALLLLFRKSREAAADWRPGREGGKRVLVVLGVTIAFVALMQVIGMVLGGAIFLAVLMRYLERHPWWLVVVVCAAAAGVNWLVFVHWLRVPLPMGVFWTS